jgi:nicotinate-nucleotide pyrophosphorylase (carboxylating)
MRLPSPRNETLDEARARNIRDALAEDIGERDWTAELVPADQRVKARVIVREDAVLCGRDWFDGCVHALDADAIVDWQCDEGAAMRAAATVCTIRSGARALLSAERPALNFLQLLSATATLTRRHVRRHRRRLAQSARLRHPGYTQDAAGPAAGAEVRGARGRRAQPAARAVARILIKENHIAAAGGIPQVLRQAAALNAGVDIQIEVETLEQLREALACGAANVMLDNFTLPLMREAVAITAGARCSRCPAACNWTRCARSPPRRGPDLHRPPDEGREGRRLLDARARAPVN